MKIDPIQPNLADGILPRVLIVDDSHIQIQALEQYLGISGFQVEHRDKPDHAKSWLAEHITDIVLIDVSLLGERDTSGLTLGKDCISISPEAVRVCISRDTVVQNDSMDVLRALNLFGSEDKMMRLFEAFGEKTRPDEILSLIAYLRRHVCCTNSAAIYCDASVLAEIDELIASRILGEKAQPGPEARRQFIEIVRRLAYRANMPEPTAIRIEPIGLGRSRTLVFAMEVQYGKLDYSSRSIIKIGGDELISQERYSYERYVPLFINHGTYPFLESCARSRNLAGIAYGHLGILESGRLPPTFAERFWATDNATASECLRRIFQLLVPQHGNVPSRAESIRSAYERRFRFLTKRELLSRRLESALARIDGKAQPQEEWTNLHFPDLPFGKLRSAMESLQGDGVAYPSYLESVVHGDLHFHNVVLTNNDPSHPFLIDFAHTGPQHALLDFIVAEVSARVQLCRPLAEDAVRLHATADFINDAMTLEAYFSADAVRRKYIPRFRDPRFSRILDMIGTIRKKAAARSGKESHSNYFVGLGLASLSILGLPGDDAASKLIRTWIAAAATIQLHLANTHQSDLTLWGAAEPSQSDDDQINAFVIDARARYDSPLLAQLARYAEFFERQTAVSDSILQSVTEILAEVHEALPRTSQTLQQIVEELVQRKSAKPKAKILAKIGIGILALQIERELQFPEDIQSRLHKLAGLIGEIKFPEK